MEREHVITQIADIDIVKLLGCENETSDVVLENIRARTLIWTLMFARRKLNLSMSGMAARMGCTETKVCQMESAADAYLNLGDVLSYANALGLEIVVRRARQSAQSKQSLAT